MSRRPARVLHILGGATGGAAMSTIGLIRALARHDISSSVVSNDTGDDVVRAELAEATSGAVTYLPLYWWNRKIRIAAWKRPLHDAFEIARTGWGRASALRVAEHAVRHRVDLIHTSTLVTPEGGIAARLLSLPHVWHVREMVGPGHPFRFPLEGRALGRHLGRRASKVVANSHASARCIAGWLPPNLLEVVPNGIDLSGFEPRSDARPAGPVVVAMVASLSSRTKRHGLFIDAIARISREVPIEARIYGDVPSGDVYTEGLKTRAERLGLGDRLRFMGWVPDPVRIMSEIDLLVQPTHEESFGRTAVEAMAAGLPVIGARGGGPGEIVAPDETGLLFPPNDSAALARAIERLATDPEARRRMGLNGRRRAEQTYSLEACAAGILRVYEAAMARPLTPLPWPARAASWRSEAR